MASNKDSTGGTTPATGEAARAVAGVGVLHSSDDLRDTTTRGEPREGTYPNAMRRGEGSGDGSTGAISAHNDSAASIHAMSPSESEAQVGFGKPDAGKPPVRFDEGRGADGHWPPGPFNPSFPAHSTSC